MCCDRGTRHKNSYGHKSSTGGVLNFADIDGVLWLGSGKRVSVLNREDLTSTADRNALATDYAREGTKVVFPMGNLE
ncbi:hypothetical protein HHK36_004406 [Tetracentron sinense]|uniref:Uncharacterized protein n=1 Tax=Tetracentron sinense TaxID=13715 RepID=A0A835A0D5_TETSI|nr:hypothetical protein HHK36_004406 [Tetracentron sinense]